MNIYKSIIIILSLIVAVFIGSLLVAIVQADKLEPITEPTETSEPIIIDEPITEPPTVNECEPCEPIQETESTTNCEPSTYEQIIYNDTGLITDSIDIIDKYEAGNWVALYCQCDGDLYVITIKNNYVDVCCILN